MKVELIRYTSDADALGGEAAAICTNYHDEGRALRGAMASGHESVIEHASFTFRVEGVSRALLAQITRHRLASFSVQSQRYVDMSKMPYVVPPSIDENYNLLEAYTDLMERIRKFYQDAVDWGIKAEDARFALPNACCTQFLMTMNARELRHFFGLRCCNRAQWEIRELADRMLELCKEAAPELFKNAGPGCVRGRCQEGKRGCGKPKKQAAETVK